MAGASRFFLPLGAPLFLLRLARNSRISLAPISSVPNLFSLYILPPPQTVLPVTATLKKFHSQPNNALPDNNHHNHHRLYHDELPPTLHPWPEWYNLLNTLGHSGGQSLYVTGDEFVEGNRLSPEFVWAARICLTFARRREDLLGNLPRSHVEVLVDNGSPFLFKSALDSERRMRSFLGTDRSSVIETDKAQTVDLMKYILTYANDATFSVNGSDNSRELIQSSVRHLLRELADLSCKVPALQGSSPEHYQVSGRYGQASRPVGPNIEMKRGDWICPKCSFMNFARNMKCLECAEPRPKSSGEWECSQCHFLNHGRNLICLRCDCKRIVEAPLGSFGALESNVHQRTGSNKDSLDQILGRSSSVFGITNKNTSQSPTYRNLKESNSNYVPFVPLPSDMFANKSSAEGREKVIMNNSESVYVESVDQTAQPGHLKESPRLPEVTPTAASMRVRERGEEEKPETWFKRVTELHDDTDIETAISEEDFPAMMPMSKGENRGENRFVMGKMKDRSLTSPRDRRQVGMEQGNNTKFVPFVPFPPDYFTKKDKSQQENTNSTRVNARVESSSNHSLPKRSEDSMNNLQRTENQQTSVEKAISSPPGDHIGTIKSPVSNSSDANISARETTSGATNPPASQNATSGWTGKSLEGSAVTEPDPLDMSEEAKAERWFRRVAQIKDISELSQIPDEDFPSIMPMRKGVNRFVVSKRKTPLERRLTSPQYRKNLPIVRSDPLKNDSDSS